MLLIGTVLVVISLSAALMGFTGLFQAGRKWLWTVAGILCGAAGFAVLKWDPTFKASELFELAGGAVLASAGVVLLRCAVLTLKRPKGRVKGLARAFLIAGAVAAVGWGVRVSPGVKQEGWWMALPTPLRIECVPWLPDAAITSRWELGTEWDLAPREPLWAWERARLRVRLEQRVRRLRTFASLMQYGIVERDGPTHEELAGIVLKNLVDRFCAEGDKDREDHAWALRSFLPMQWKSVRITVGAERERAAMRGRVQRLVELSYAPGLSESHTAVELITLCGEEALAAVPRLFELAAKEVGSEEPVYAAQSTLEYLTMNVVPVREDVLCRLGSADQGVRLVAIRSLDHYGWKQAEVATRLQALTHHEDRATADAALAALSRIRS